MLVDLMGRYSKYGKLLKPANRVQLLDRSTWPQRMGSAPQLTRLAARLDDIALKQLAADYESGATGRQLAERYGLARSSVIKLLREHEVAVRHPRTTPDEQAQIVRLYQSGLSQVEIAARFGRHKSVVWHVLERAGALDRT